MVLAGRPEAEIAFTILPRFPVPWIELRDRLEHRAATIHAALDEGHRSFLGAPRGLEVTSRVLYLHGWSGRHDSSTDAGARNGESVWRYLDRLHAAVCRWIALHR